MTPLTSRSQNCFDDAANLSPTDMRPLLPEELRPERPLPTKVAKDSQTTTDVLMPDSPAEAERQLDAITFPPEFLLGAATAAYQVEGGLHKCNWAKWERDGLNHGHRAGKACDVWNLFEQDVKMMKELGVRCYRFSVDWSRCEPEEESYDWEAIERYVSWCRLLRASGIEPMVTLHHFVEPEWFDSLGGWEKQENVTHFARFVETVGARLVPHCRYWCTLNELNGFAMCGFVGGVHPPGRRNDAIAMIVVIKNMLVAHTRAARSIRALSAAHAEQAARETQSGVAGAPPPRPPVICLAMSHVLFTPTPGWGLLGLLSSAIAVVVSYLFNFVYHDAVVYGAVAWPVHLIVWLVGWSRELADLKGTVDVIGVNHYYRSVVAIDRDKAGGRRQASAADLFLRLPFGFLLTAQPVDGFEKSDMGWDLTPSSMEVMLRKIWRRYQVPIFVTESGIADGEAPDTRRTRYLSGILQMTHRLMREEGVDIRGYLLWTLLDNFEWAEGFGPRFGLFHTDFKTFNRSERSSTPMLKRLFHRGKPAQ